MSDWEKWLNDQSAADIATIAAVAVQRLIELEEVCFRIDDYVKIDGDPIDEEDVVDECLYWRSCGEDLRVPF